jgi:cellulose synthase/poly-beta-1,6-N-acetylglucosamine synthase-like glycosyltransferase
MIVFDIITIVLLAILLFWTVYNGSIIYVGIKNKRKTAALQTSLSGTLPKISLIVPTKNEGVVIKRCLDGILDINYPKDKMEVIVVDGDSKDNTCRICHEYAKNYPSLIKVIVETTSKGKPAALNLALAATTGEIVGIFDADSLPEKDVLTKVSSYFKDEKIVAVQGRTTSINE